MASTATATGTRLEVVPLRLVLLHQLRDAPLEPVKTHPREEDVRVHARVGHQLRPGHASSPPGPVGRCSSVFSRETAMRSIVFVEGVVVRAHLIFFPW